MNNLKRKNKQNGQDFDENPASYFLKAIFNKINKSPIWVRILILVVFMPAFIWWNWDDISKMPGVSIVLEKTTEMLETISIEKTEKFSILVAKLDNDLEEINQNIIIDALVDKFGNEIEVIRTNIKINTNGSASPQQDLLLGHAKAQEILGKTNANVMVWGKTTYKTPGSMLRLHWTIKDRKNSESNGEKYLPTDKTYDLPELFWNDLDNVLFLLAASQLDFLNGKDNYSKIEQYNSFVNKLEFLIASKNIGIQKNSELKLILADSLLNLGGIKNEISILEKASSIYAENLESFNQGHIKLNWFAAQNGLAMSYVSISERDPRIDKYIEAKQILEKVLTATNCNCRFNEWIEVNFNLAYVLQKIGERSPETEDLKNSIKIYRSLIAMPVLEAKPANLALTRINLAGAQTTLGIRLGDPITINEAIENYSEIFKTLTQSNDRDAWARAKHNFGVTLWSMGLLQRQGNYLGQALLAFSDALKERTKDRTPIEWAETQANLAGLLVDMGEREFSSIRFREAVLRLEEALLVITKKNAPFLWALAQHNYGNALFSLGEQEKDLRKIEDSIDAFRKALSIRSLESSPVDWALSQLGLGNALLILGRNQYGANLLNEAMVAYKSSMIVRTQAAMPLQWAQSQHNLGYAFFHLGVRSIDSSYLQKSIDTFRSALIVRTKDRFPFEWASTQNGLGDALKALGTRAFGTNLLEQSVDAHNTAALQYASLRLPAYEKIARTSSEDSRKTLRMCRAENYNYQDVRTILTK